MICLEGSQQGSSLYGARGLVYNSHILSGEPPFEALLPIFWLLHPFAPFSAMLPSPRLGVSVDTVEHPQLHILSTLGGGVTTTCTHCKVGSSTHPYGI